MHSDSYEIEGEIKNIEEAEKRMYEYLPAPTIPKSLTIEKTKNILLDVNEVANSLYSKHGQVIPEEHLEKEPLIIETLAQDLACVEYDIHENIFRYAIHKYQLQNDK